MRNPRVGFESLQEATLEPDSRDRNETYSIVSVPFMPFSAWPGIVQITS